MGECLITRRGVGNNLNFKIVNGTTKPVNPKENTIWVNTDIEIPNWMFSADGLGTFKSDNLFVSASVEESLVGTDIIELPNGTFKIIIGNKENNDSTPTTGELYTCNFYDKDGNNIKIDRNTLPVKCGGYEIDVPVGATGVKLSVHPLHQKLIAIYANVGDVWFKTAQQSTSKWITPINILKKNNITIYISDAYQYIDGKWNIVEAETYQDGAWHPWKKWLFNYGNEYNELTGGWTTTYYQGSWNSDYVSDKFIVTSDEKSLGMKQVEIHNGSTVLYSGFSTKNKIDLSNVNTIYIYANVIGDFYVAINDINEVAKYTKYNKPDGHVFEIDISSYEKDEGNISFYVLASTNAEGFDSFDAFQVYLE